MEVTFYHRELRDGAAEMLQALKSRGYHLGVISNNASLYNVFRVLEDYGIRGFMEDVTVSSVTGYRKPHPEIFRIALRQMQAKPEMCVYVGDTVSRDIIGPKQVGFAKAVQIRSFLSEQKDVHVAADAAQPDKVIGTLMDLVTWLDQINPELAPPPAHNHSFNLLTLLFLFLAERRPAEWPGRLPCCHEIRGLSGELGIV